MLGKYIQRSERSEEDEQRKVGETADGRQHIILLV
jgi:hypothetical protein